MDAFTFREEQRFRQPWLWLLVGLSSGGGIGVALYGMYQQFVLHVPFGNKPMSDGTFMVFGPCMVLLMLTFLGLFSTTRLITEVRGDGVYVKFFPFHLRYHWFLFSDIVNAEAITYRPIRDYGGWGIRYGKDGKGYNVSGNQGVKLIFRNGSTLMIGSQRADALAAAVHAANIQWGKS